MQLPSNSPVLCIHFSEWAKQHIFVSTAQCVYRIYTAQQSIVSELQEAHVTQLHHTARTTLITGSASSLRLHNLKYGDARTLWAGRVTAFTVVRPLLFVAAPDGIHLFSLPNDGKHMVRICLCVCVCFFLKKKKSVVFCEKNKNRRLRKNKTQSKTNKKK